MEKRLCMGGVVDRISGLPEGILHHILYFLPMPKAVCTSILSKRWRYLWTSMPSIRLDRDDATSDREFKDFVNELLAQREPINLVEFTLVWTLSSDPQEFNTWIDYAITHNVWKLNLHIGTHSKSVHLRGILNCQSLQELQLAFYEHVPHLPRLICLRNLKSLCLSYFHFGSCDSSSSRKDALNKLIAGCPSLECLRLEHCSFHSLNVMAPATSNQAVAVAQSPGASLRSLCLRDCSFWILGISAPKLEELYIHLSDGDRSSIDGDEEARIFLSVPNLRFFYYHTDSYRRFTTDDIQCLVKASLKLDNASASECIHDILKALRNTLYLELSALVMKYLLYKDNQMGCLPTFPNLRKLKLTMRPNKSSFQATSYLLQLSPNLESLLVNDLPSRRKKIEDEQRCWKPTGTLLNFSHHIATVKITDFLGSASEYAFLKFLITKAKALNNVNIVPAEHETEESPSNSDASICD